MLIPVYNGLGADAGSLSLSLGAPIASGGAVLGGAALSTTGITAASLATAGITAGVGLVIAAISLWMSRKGPQQNVITTGYVNQAEPLLRQNLAAWNASPKDCANLTACIQNAQTILNEVVAACANPNLGDPGHSCIDDRWPSGVTFNTGAPANFNIVGNGRYNWFDYYVKPILTDAAIQNLPCCPPQVCYDPACTALYPMPSCNPSAASAPGSQGDGASAGGGAGAPFNPALLVAAAVIAVIWAVAS